MKGILIYPQSEIARNSFAIKQFKKNLNISLEKEAFDGSADYVINRTNNENIAKKFEQKGIRVFNPSQFCALANDKKKCYNFMEKNSIPILPIDYKKPPLVAKPRFGKGGEDVRLITKEPIPCDDSLVLQKCATDLGKDLRVWVIGGQIITSVLRINKTDFRSNYCLGGIAHSYKLNENEIKQVKKIISLVDGDYYGIDFLFNDGKIIFNELEDTVGARMVYDLTDIDIIAQYCNYIKTMLS